MNFVPTNISNGSAKASGFEVTLPKPLNATKGTLGFRPEAVVVGDGPVAGRIRIVEDLGSEVFVHLVIDNDGEERRIANE